jgi:hypothetical protein
MQGFISPHARNDTRSYVAFASLEPPRPGTGNAYTVSSMSQFGMATPELQKPKADPIKVVDSRLHIHDTGKDRDGSILPSAILSVDSRDRNREQYPYANSFRLELPTPLYDIHTVELLQAVVPVVPSVTEPCVILRCMQVPLIDQAVPIRADDSDRPPFSGGAQDALMQLYIAGAASRGEPFAYWESSDYRVLKHFPAGLASMRAIDISLWVRSGDKLVPYPLPIEPPGNPLQPTNNITLTFEITSIY